MAREKDKGNSRYLISIHPSQDNTRIVGRYALAYVADLIINAIQTIALAVTWFMSRNDLLTPHPDQSDDSSTPISDEIRQDFQFEGGISILILLSLWCLHVSLALLFSQAGVISRLNG